MTTSHLEKAIDLLRPVPDFPKPGILFWDISPVIRDSIIFKEVIDHIADHWKDMNIETVAMFDARGFLFGPMLGIALDAEPVMIRKKGKLPPPVVSQDYGLEYGTDVIEMIDDGSVTGKNVLLVDDLLATGGTAEAGVQLIKKLGGSPVGFTCPFELADLNGRAKIEVPCFAPMIYRNNAWHCHAEKMIA